MIKIIDEKGRILGKINVIDFIAIVLIVNIVPMSYFGSKLASYKKPVPEKNEVKLEVQIKFQRVMPELASFLSEGNTDGEETGRLKKITVNKNAELVALGKNDQAVVMQDPTAREITATFDLICIEEDGYVKYKGYVVKIGNAIVFSTNLYTIQGFVVGIRR